MAGHRTDPPPNPEPAVVRALDELQKAHAIGQVLDEKTRLGGYGEHKVRQLSAKHGCSEEKGRRLRQFATVYSQADLDRLCDLCKQHGCVLKISMVFKFITIKEQQDRSKIEEEAISGHWTHVQLERELRHRFRRKRGNRGRKPKLPSTKIEALEQAQEMAYTFVRFAARLQDEGRKWLSDQVAKDLTQTVVVLESLQASTARSLARSKAGRSGTSRRSRSQS